MKMHRGCEAHAPHDHSVLYQNIPSLVVVPISARKVISHPHLAPILQSLLMIFDYEHLAPAINHAQTPLQLRGIRSGSAQRINVLLREGMIGLVHSGER
jgi:hypothetical protein